MVDDPISHDGWLLRPDSTKNVASTSVTLYFHMTLQIGREFGFIHHQPSTCDSAVPSVLPVRLTYERNQNATCTVITTHTEDCCWRERNLHEYASPSLLGVSPNFAWSFAWIDKRSTRLPILDARNVSVRWEDTCLTALMHKLNPFSFNTGPDLSTLSIHFSSTCTFKSSIAWDDPHHRFDCLVLGMQLIIHANSSISWDCIVARIDGVSLLLFPEFSLLLPSAPKLVSFLAFLERSSRERIPLSKPP
ncbi:hypothetical protein VNO77_34252 [Canavalia gladiata]|uniref:Uncharacterized protein n=1 Tax=Canavalia gladiata TaxID=3824 RepID=A0AAN9KDA3_CANGL